MSTNERMTSQLPEKTAAELTGNEYFRIVDPDEPRLSRRDKRVKIKSLGIGGGVGAVDSVNGKTGAVVLKLSNLDGDENHRTVTESEKSTWSGKEPAIQPGTAAQYYRGDKTWQALPTRLPASDVFSWAKAPYKPTYTYSEVGAAAAIHTHPEYLTGITSSMVMGVLGYTPISAALKGAARGLAELDATGKVPAAQLPAFVDDIIEVSDYAHLPASGETGKIYVTLSDNKTYRWGGTAYVIISDTLALGETSSTAYRGDRGAVAYGHSLATGNPHGTTLADLQGDAMHRTVSDAEKATWSGKQDAISYIPLNAALKGAIGGLAELDATGKVPAAQLPAFVDDVVEVADFAHLPASGETGKIYVTLSDNKTYRWGGTNYAIISDTLALGETSSTAYRGDRGAVAYGHSLSTGNPHGTTLADLQGDATHRTVSDAEKATWSGKQDAIGYTPENAGNRVASVSALSTDTQYPTAKCLYNAIGNIESLLAAI